MSRLVSASFVLASALMVGACNQPPTAPVIEFDPPEPLTGDDVDLVFVSSAVDPEGEELDYEITWTIDDSASTSHTGARGVAAFETSKGETWSVTVIPVDLSGGVGASATASFTVLNTAPIAALQMSPDSGEAGRDDDLLATVSTHDADGDTVTWDLVWTANGVRVPAYDNITLVPSSATGDDEVWVAEVTPNDGDDDGQAITGTVVVSNAIPTVADIDLQPASPVEGDTLRVVAFGADGDGDDVVLTYAWFVNGAEVAGEETDSLTSEFFDKHDEVWVVITPDDGFTVGSPETSATRTVLNTVPIVDSVVLSPGIGNEQTTFTCLPQGWVDPDPGDDPSYTYQWYIDGNPASTGATLDGTSFDKHQVLACSATPFDADAQGTTHTSEAVTVSNSPPWAGITSLGPLSATEETSFTCTPTGFGDFDPADSEGWEIAWLVNGFDINVTVDILNGDQFDKGDEVQCVATPVDGETEGAPSPSTTVTVQNTAPPAPTVSISPTAADEDTEFSCTASGWTDPDPADSEAYEIVWFVNGSPVSTAETLTGDMFNRDDDVHCLATPYDGEDNGPDLTSDTVTVANTAPTLGSASLSPSDPVQSTDITVDVQGFADVDGDPASYVYRWFIDGDELLTATEATLPTSAFTKDQTVYAMVHPHDGTLQGDPVTSNTVTIGNTVPVMSGVSVEPQSGTEETVFTCVPAGWSDPDGVDVESYHYRWLVNGALSVTTPTLDGSQFDKHDEISCEASPTDGVDIGDKHTSSGVTIANTPPSLDHAAINPTGGDITTTFTCSTFGWVDPDPGDDPTYAFQWVVDGSPSVQTQQITSDDFDRDQVITCRAIPVDSDSQGNAELSLSVTVANAIPTLVLASLTPSSQGFESTVFQLSLLGFDDADGDPEGYEYVWSVDGQVVATGTPTLDGSSFDKGQEVSVEVAPFDGREAGEGFSLGPVSIFNTPPQVDSMVISPNPGQTGEPLVVTGVGFVDIDGDAEDYAYEWFVDGSLVTGVNIPELNPGFFSTGAVVTVTATPFDGEASGTPVTSESVTVEELVCHSLDFDGDDDNVRVSGLADYPYARPLTMESWILWDNNDTTDFEPVLSQWSAGESSGVLVAVVGRDHTDPVCGALNAGQVVVSFADDHCQATTPTVAPGEWTHLAVVALPTQLRVYLDGVPSGAMPNADVPASSAQFRFGEQDGAAFGGQISVTRISSVARYAGPFAPPTTITSDADTVAGWGFLEGTGNFIEDVTDVFHGQIDGPLWVELPSCTFEDPT